MPANQPPNKNLSDVPPSYDEYLNSLSQNNPINTQYQNGHQNPIFQIDHSNFVSIPSNISSIPSTIYVIQQPQTRNGDFEMSQIPPDNGAYVEEEKPQDPCPCVCLLMFVFLFVFLGLWNDNLRRR